MALFLENSGLELPLGGEVKTATSRGIEYSYQYLSTGRGRQPELRVWCHHPNRGHLNVRRERSGDRFFKRIGLVAEVQTRDRKFDAAYFIDSAEPAFAQALFSSPAAREAIETIMACGSAEVVLNEDMIMARLVQPAFPSQTDNTLQDAVAGLHRLSEDQPQIPDHLGRDSRKRWHFRLGVIYTVLAFATVTGAGLVFLGLAQWRPLDTGRLFLHSLLFSLPGCALILYFLVFAIRGRSNSHTHFVISTLITIAALLLLGHGVLMFMNAYTDRSPAALYRVEVISKRITRAKNERTYRVSVASWRANGAYEELKVPRDLYERIEPGRDRLDITTRGGRFGYEWLTDAPTPTKETPKPVTKRTNHD